MTRAPRVVVITGASAGVGRETARAFARRGDAVALIAREPERLEAARAEAQALGARAIAIALDVADAAAVDRAASRIEAELGPIDVWVNNAMAAVLAFVHETDAADFHRVMKVTFLGQVHGTLAALRHMRPRDRGTIVMVGSALAYRAIPCRRPTARRSTPPAASPTRCAASSCTSAAACGSRPSISPGSTRRSSAGCAPRCAVIPSRSPPSMSPSSPPRRSCAPATIRGARSSSAARPSPRSSATGSPRAPPICGSPAPRSAGSRPRSRSGPHRPDYLYEPLPGDRGSHGIFDDEAANTSPTWWLTKHRNAAASALVAAIAGTLAARRARAVAPETAWRRGHR
jgi:NAD(P)-dependent dehydrogenase (short-subunit alcohol dehydrogenase family)